MRIDKWLLWVTMDLGLVWLRVVFGLLMASHGAQKLFGWFGGAGVEGTAGFFDKLGYQPGKLFAVVAGLTELVGGLLLAAGLAMPLACAMVIGVMLNAVNTEWANGFYKGAEKPLLFAAVAVGLAFTGPGKYSVDEGRPWPWKRDGQRWALGGIGLGVVGALVTLLIKK